MLADSKQARKSLTVALREAQLARSLPRPEERRQWRESAGVSQAALARELSVTTTAISMWENGHRSPRGRLLLDYLRVLERLKAAS